MTDDETSRKRSIPEPLSHAMMVSDFPLFNRKVEYVAMVRAQLENMKAAPLYADLGDLIDAIENHEQHKEERDRKIDNALLLLEFFELCVHNRHAVEGIEDAKKKFTQDSGSYRDSISKSSVVGPISGGGK